MRRSLRTWSQMRFKIGSSETAADLGVVAWRDQQMSVRRGSGRRTRSLRSSIKFCLTMAVRRLVEAVPNGWTGIGVC
jgi:hypothetical protein